MALLVCMPGFDCERCQGAGGAGTIPAARVSSCSLSASLPHVLLYSRLHSLPPAYTYVLLCVLPRSRMHVLPPSRMYFCTPACTPPSCLPPVLLYCLVYSCTPSRLHSLLYSCTSTPSCTPSYTPVLVLPLVLLFSLYLVGSLSLCSLPPVFACSRPPVRMYQYSCSPPCTPFLRSVLHPVRPRSLLCSLPSGTPSLPPRT